MSNYPLYPASSRAATNELNLLEGLLNGAFWSGGDGGGSNCTVKTAWLCYSRLKDLTAAVVALRDQLAAIEAMLGEMAQRSIAPGKIKSSSLNTGLP